jgi:hypothetical protein
MALYLKQTRNAWFEMHISSVVHVWSKKTKKYRCIPSFPLKTNRRYLINYNILTNIKHFPCWYTVISTRVEIVGKREVVWIFTQFRVFLISTSVDITVYQYGKNVLYLFYNIAERNIKKGGTTCSFRGSTCSGFRGSATIVQQGQWCPSTK